jgi:hypothetical protein
MTKHIISFTYPDDREEHELCLNASKLYCALWDIQEYLRQEWKYNDEAYTEEQFATLEAIREKFHALLIENEVEL